MILLGGALGGLGIAALLRRGWLVALRDEAGEGRRRSMAVVRARAAARHRHDLALLSVTPELHAARTVAWALAGAGAGVGVGLGVVAVASAPAIAACVVAFGVVAGALAPGARLRAAATRRRRDVLHAFSSYLDLVQVLLAGGAGVETALVAAAEAGDGWAFERLRECVVRARSARRSVWDELARFGARVGIPQIEEVAGSVRLAGEHGARVRLSLAARADSLRQRQMGELEAAAQSATERMGVPMVGLFLAFIVLVGYPAVALVLDGL
jgi:Flp pilus assembly protein TadB